MEDPCPFFNSYSRSPQQPLALAQIPITPAQMNEVHRYLGAMADLAHDFPAGGCYARSHVQCRRLFALGFQPKKPWAFRGAERLHVTGSDGRYFEWDYHVAFALPVQLPDGRVVDMVSDNCLFDRPVDVATWGKRINAPEGKLYCVPFGVIPPGQTGDYEPRRGILTTEATDADARGILDLCISLAVQQGLRSLPDISVQSPTRCPIPNSSYGG